MLSDEAPLNPTSQPCSCSTQRRPHHVLADTDGWPEGMTCGSMSAADLRHSFSSSACHPLIASCPLCAHGIRGDLAAALSTLITCSFATLSPLLRMVHTRTHCPASSHPEGQQPCRQYAGSHGPASSSASRLRSSTASSRLVAAAHCHASRFVVFCSLWQRCRILQHNTRRLVFR